MDSKKITQKSSDMFCLFVCLDLRRNAILFLDEQTYKLLY